jgi:hypothetical protein
MIDTEHLEGLVRAIDTTAEERGWNEGHLLVNIVGADAEGADVGFKDIEGHPLNSLLGFTAPAEWLGLGVCAEGWAASVDAAEFCRPSRAKGRMRIRTTVLVTRDGAVASGMRLAGEEFKLMPDEGSTGSNCSGTILDALKRAMGVATGPPEVTFEGWVARMLLMLIIGDVPRGHRRVPWTQLRASLERYRELADEGSWETLRGVASKRAGVIADLEPGDAAWMDEGMFSRWAIGGMASYEHLLEKAREASTPEAFSQVRRQLKAWGLPVRVRRAA